MSTDEQLSPADEMSAEQAITIQPSGIAAFPGSGEWMLAGGEASGQDAGGSMAVLHAVRRHWLMILSIGVACAAVTGTALWLTLKPQYRADAYLELAPSGPVILNKTADQQQGPNEFDIFRDTQLSYLKSPFVIMAALRDPKLKGRACVQREDLKHNANAWLTEEIRVDFTAKNAGIMRISATEPDPQDAAAMVNAVVDAYMNEVVNRDRQERRVRLSELQQISAEKENEVRTKREQLKRELENIGAPDDQTMAARATLALNIYSQALNEFQILRAQNRGLVGKLKELKTLLADVPNTEIPESEVTLLLINNPTYRELQSRRLTLEQMARMHGIVAVPGLKQNVNFSRTQAELNATKSQIDELDQQIRGQVRAARRIELEREVRRLESQIDVSAEQLASFEKEVEKKRDEADNVGKSSVAAQMARAEVENIERVLRNVAEERERLRVEINAPSRVKIAGDPSSPAAVPEVPNNDRVRHMLIVAGSFLALCMPCIGVVMWDLRKRRINSVEDVSKRLKIPVIGAVPQIPAMVMRRLGDATKRSQEWKLRFTGAVDGAAARLLRKAERDQARVILVTSALAGEGKTTLATQLAMSLARHNRRTVLVDFDLRRPTLDSALGLPLGPGVCEALRGTGDVMDMVQQTETECLSVVTAGSWNRQTLVALGNGTVGTILERLRANFEFVIIDSSPLLPVVDTRLLCQHVDSVLLSVFRDVSEGSKVQAAQEMLDAFGVRSLEAVVIGGEYHGGARNWAYQAAVADEQFPAPGELGLLKEDPLQGGDE